MSLNTQFASALQGGSGVDINGNVLGDVFINQFANPQESDGVNGTGFLHVIEAVRVGTGEVLAQDVLMQIGGAYPTYEDFLDGQHTPAPHEDDQCDYMQIFAETDTVETIATWYYNKEQVNECIDDDYLTWLFGQEELPCVLMREQLAFSMEATFEDGMIVPRMPVFNLMEWVGDVHSNRTWMTNQVTDAMRVRWDQCYPTFETDVTTMTPSEVNADYIRNLCSIQETCTEEVGTDPAWLTLFRDERDDDVEEILYRWLLGDEHDPEYADLPWSDIMAYAYRNLGTYCLISRDAVANVIEDEDLGKTDFFSCWPLCFSGPQEYNTGVYSFEDNWDVCFPTFGNDYAEIPEDENIATYIRQLEPTP